MINQEKVFKIKKAVFYLPHYPTDCISRAIVESHNYWDNWYEGALPKIDKYLKENAIILDIGANIGSHTVYWALERNAKKIYSFEPLSDTYDVLETNIELNNLKNIVTTYNIGLSDNYGKFRVESYNDLNVGATSFAEDKDGEFEFKSLDSFDIKEPINMIKIDVEGAEVRVLNGAIKTITQSKPILVIETYTLKSEVDDFLSSIDYVQVDTIREGEDYIYLHKSQLNQ